ncbi:adenylate kinase [Bacteroidota bacterium]
MKYYIIFGPPGAGKGTQSSLLVERYNLRHISTGQLLRDEIEKKSKTGIIAKELIECGKFVDDSIVLGMISDVIKNPDPGVKGFIFDGFPRTISQAEAFDCLLKRENNQSVSAVLSLEVDDNVIVDRIRKRAEIEGRKDDSSIETVLGRIQTYHKKTEPLKEYYKQKGKFYPVGGELEVDSIFRNICSIMESIDNE